MVEIATAPHIEIVVYAAYIVKGFSKGPNISARPNWDLWRTFWLAVKARWGLSTTQFMKINPHLREEHIEQGFAEL